MSYILFHIPHSALKIPNEFWKICIKERDYIDKTNIFLSDILTDKLAPYNCRKLVFKYSRLFCDVEKFKDDSKEIMAKKGMGVIYTNDCDDQISIPNKKYKRKIIKSYYDKYHNKLDKIVTNILKKYNRCILIDLHSFSDDMIKKLFDVDKTPDICIGTDKYYTDKKILDFTVKYFEKYDYSVAINDPYAGTIVPNKYLNYHDSRLSSIMIEVNKRVYLKSEFEFYKIKNCLNDYYNEIKNL